MYSVSNELLDFRKEARTEKEQAERWQRAEENEAEKSRKMKVEWDSQTVQLEHADASAAACESQLRQNVMTTKKEEEERQEFIDQIVQNGERLQAQNEKANREIQRLTAIIARRIDAYSSNNG